MGSAELTLMVGLVLGGYAVYNLISFFLSAQADKAQLSWANQSEPVKSKNKIIELSRPLVHQFTLSYAMKIKSPSYREKVRRWIKTGGLSRELNEDEFIGMQILWAIVFPILMAILNFALEFGLPWILFPLLAPFGYYMMIMHANASKKIRQESVRLDMPFYVDLLALSVEAGLDFFSAIGKIVEKAKGTDSVLAAEFAQVLADTQIGSSKAQALMDMADRLDMAEMTSFVAVLVDAESSGAPISRVLKEQSEQMRLERFVRAEKAGARASQTILIPVVVFILPAIFIMVMGPIAVSFFQGSK
ncbi:MAG: type II secretion system F family protein [Bdellovibrionaceae bacterium]|nr:type II secretion system F family protein [Pseudobdellovibrionaceae bacterium]